MIGNTSVAVVREQFPSSDRLQGATLLHENEIDATVFGQVMPDIGRLVPEDLLERIL